MRKIFGYTPPPARDKRQTLLEENYFETLRFFRSACSKPELFSESTLKLMLDKLIKDYKAVGYDFGDKKRE